MKYNITDLIPQRRPFVMVDDFALEGDGSSKTCLTVREDNIFCGDGLLSECGLIEHMAQSAAARAGFSFKEKGMEVPVGFIGSVNDFHMESAVPVGETVTTFLSVIQEVGPVSLIEARSFVSGRLVAGTKMKIFLDLK